MGIKFHKFSGTGNDFILLDQISENFNFDQVQIQNWCHRRNGVGADGVLVLRPSSEHAFKMEIYNADGSQAEMCGNGARCCLYYLKNVKNYSDALITFETLNGIYEGRVEGANVQLKMTELYDEEKYDVSDLGNGHCYYLNTGVPHTVIQVSSLNDVNVQALGKVVRFDKRFDGGTNVDFFEITDEKQQKVKVRVYERGVEGETLCCGTGVMAVAMTCHRKLGWTGEIKVQTAGGDVSAIIKDDLFYQGEVSHVFQGELV